MSKSTGDLEIDEDLGFQRKQWIFERIGWAASALLVVAALIGLFGRGPVSQASSTSEDGSLRLEYDKFGRFQAHTKLVAHVAIAPGDQYVRLWLSQSYIDGVEVQQITPEPVKTTCSAGGLLYEFPLQGNTETAEISFLLEPDTFGQLRGQMALQYRSPVVFKQFIYP